MRGWKTYRSQSEDRWKQREWKEGERGEKIKAKRESLSNRTSRLCARRARDKVSVHVTT